MSSTMYIVEQRKNRGTREINDARRFDDRMLALIAVRNARKHLLNSGVSLDAALLDAARRLDFAHRSIAWEMIDRLEEQIKGERARAA